MSLTAGSVFSWVLYTGEDLQEACAVLEDHTPGIW